MIRFISALAIAICIAASAHADVLDLLRAGLAARSRGDFDAAISFYTQAINTDALAPPHLAVVLNSRGVAYDIKGDPDKAIKDFDAAIQLKADYAEAFINRGLAWVNKSEYDHAIVDFTEAASLDARGAFLAFSNRGGAYADKGDYDRAIEDYGRAIRLRPDYADAYYGRARTYTALGQTENAIADYDAAIRIKPNFPDAYNNRGVLNIAKGETAQAIADFDAAIRFNPNDPSPFVNRGYAFEVKGEYDRAISDFNEAIRRDPYSASLYFNRGVARLYSGRADAAVQDFAIGVRFHPSDAYAVIWLHLARVRAGQDDRQEFTRNAANIDRSKWPGLIVDLHLGSVSGEVVSSATLSDGEAKARRKRACEIEFHLAIFELGHGARDEALQHLRTAADTCPLGDIERVAAAAQLAEIESKQ
jgi:tetratricopeptide (TPR) repeat protein